MEKLNSFLPQPETGLLLTRIRGSDTSIQNNAEQHMQIQIIKELSSIKISRYMFPSISKDKHLCQFNTYTLMPTKLNFALATRWQNSLWFKSTGSGVRQLGFKFGFTMHYLSNFLNIPFKAWQFTEHLLASVCSSIKWNNETYLQMPILSP